MSHVLLASRSPRRRELLEEVGFHVSVFADDVDESTEETDPLHAAMSIARRKGEGIAGRARALAPDADFVLSSDTIVWTDDGTMLGKPRDRDHGRAMLRLLLGRTHAVTTGFALFRPGESAPAALAHSTARVTMAALSASALEAYLDSDEPWDKAGGYAVQGLAGAFISRIEGSWHTVVGLPVHDVLHAAQSLGLIVRMPWERSR